jgi:hypothetical protein
MMPFDRDQAIEEMRDVLAEAEALVPADMSSYTSGQDPSQAISLIRSAIERFTPERSSYRRQVDKLLQNAVAAARADTAGQLMGTLEALISDFEKGRLRTFEELIHSDVSADYLQQAETLLKAGYKDAAIVIAGSVLEQHLRQLADKHGVGLFSGGVWKKADRLNADLAKHEVYGKTEQKLVTAVLGRRNEAAHGNYHLYTSDDARVLIEQINTLLARYPA